MLGNRYGYRPFPTNIAGQEFEVCLKVAEENKFADLDLLLEWYSRDDNAVPPHYVLQVLVILGLSLYIVFFI
jgi:hypothetical protein